MESLNESSGDKFWNESQLDDSRYNNTPGKIFYDDNVFRRFVLSFLLIGMLGNLITILYVTYSKQLHTPTFLAICSLAVTDFIVVLFSLVVQLAIKNVFFLNNIIFVLYIIIYIAMVKSSCDVVLLFFLRYALIVHPLKCRQYLTKSFVISASLVLWGYSFIALVLVQFIQYCIYNLNIGDSESYVIGTAVTILIVTVLPIIIISVLHCQKLKALRPATVNTAITRKMSCVIIIIAVLNVFFGIILYFMSEAYITGLMNSFNPFIFFIFHVPYRKCVATLLSFCRRE